MTGTSLIWSAPHPTNISRISGNFLLSIAMATRASKSGPSNLEKYTVAALQHYFEEVAFKMRLSRSATLSSIVIAVVPKPK